MDRMSHVAMQPSIRFNTIDPLRDKLSDPCQRSVVEAAPNEVITRSLASSRLSPFFRMKWSTPFNLYNSCDE